MRILHTADLHLGQVLYQNYTREDEHDHFFRQLEDWCRAYNPDALLVSGDIFDIQQPGANTKRRFNEYFVSLHKAFPQMALVITAGNHDSASRIHADNAVWSLGNVKLVGLPPASDSLSHPEGWQRDYIVEMPQGYVVAMPFVTGNRKDIVQALLDYVAQRNNGQKPVVLMGHMAVSGSDFSGLGFDIGHLQTVPLTDLGSGFDYMALGHIHRPQTIGHPDEHQPLSTYPAGVVRYSGSPLHVSCDEKFPHSVSLVDIDRHGGTVSVTRLRVEQLRHFYELPPSGVAVSAQQALDAIKQFALEKGSGYFRLTMDYHAAIPADFDQQIYRIIEPYGDEIRYNPKRIETNLPDQPDEEDTPVFQVTELQQMTDPMEFIRQTQTHYPELDINDLALAFQEVETEIRRQSENLNTPSHEN